MSAGSSSIGPAGYPDLGSDEDISLPSDGESLFDTFTGQDKSHKDVEHILFAEFDDSGFTRWPPLLDVYDTRILVIDPCAGDANHFHCELQTISLQNPYVYYTLSYLWGPTLSDGSHLTRQFHCDGQATKVTYNLEIALRTVCQTWRRHFSSDSSEPLRLWVDALRINQPNVLERRSQVMLMRQIYSCSRGLFIWERYLPNPSELDMTTSGMDDEMNDQMGDEMDTKKSFRPNYETDDETDEETDDETTNATASETGSEKDTMTGPVRARYARGTSKHRGMYEWSRRRWALQELMLSPGQRWVLFRHGYRLNPFEQSHLAHWLAVMTNGVSKAGTLALLELLQIFHGALCADPRDRIYALKSVSSDLQQLIVDYTQDTRACFTCVAQQYLDSSALPKLLAYAATRRRTCIARQEFDTSNYAKGFGDRTQLVLPSWVPDWTKSVELLSKVPNRNSNHQRMNLILKQFADDEQIHLGSEEYGKIVRVRGHALEDAYDETPSDGPVGLYRGTCATAEGQLLTIEGWVVGPCSTRDSCTCGPFRSAMHDYPSGSQRCGNEVLLLLEGVNLIYTGLQRRDGKGSRSQIQLDRCLLLNKSLNFTHRRNDEQSLVVARQCKVDWQRYKHQQIDSYLLRNRILTVCSRAKPIEKPSMHRDKDAPTTVSDFVPSLEAWHALLPRYGTEREIHNSFSRSYRFKFTGALFDMIEKERPEKMWAKTSKENLWEDGTMLRLLEPWEKMMVTII